MAGRQSKTARASVRAGTGAGTGAVSVLGEIKFLIPLNKGRNAYVRNITSDRTPNLRTDSEEIIEEVRQLATAGHGVQLRAELERLTVDLPDDGWDVVLKRLDEAGALG